MRMRVYPIITDKARFKKRLFRFTVDPYQRSKSGSVKPGPKSISALIAKVD
jgi:hypothetical protein